MRIWIYHSVYNNRCEDTIVDLRLVLGTPLVETYDAILFSDEVKCVELNRVQCGVMKLRVFKLRNVEL